MKPGQPGMGLKEQNGTLGTELDDTVCDIWYKDGCCGVGVVGEALSAIAGWVQLRFSRIQLRFT
eukprot:scaffold10334_cov54-Cyclotella_meneghiniana.AAC.4